MKLTLKTSLIKLYGVGKILAGRLNNLGLQAVEDLLYYFPFRYEDFSQITPIGNIPIGGQVTIRGKIDLIANKRTPRKRMVITEALISDQTGTIKAIWFNQPFLTTVLKKGEEFYFSGKIESGYYGIQLTSPVYEQVKTEQTHTARLVPIYPTTEGLSQKQLRFLIKTSLPLTKKVKDWLPEGVKAEEKLLALSSALAQVHFPDSQKIATAARQRLSFDELFLIQLSLLKNKQELKRLKAPLVRFQEAATKKFVAALPFKLTDAQRRSAWEILKDLEKDRPMNRLLEGDVGSGKTLVAAIAMYNTALNGYQSVLMAPTEILAFQHLQTLSKFLAKTDLNLALLTRSQKSISTGPKRKILKLTKKTLLSAIADGSCQIIIGTHALISSGGGPTSGGQEKACFKNLALAIVDEQHRFGVEQRQAIINKTSEQKVNCHFLSLTATPIPRSLALTIYGDLDLSILDEMPPGRQKPITQIIDSENRQATYNFISEQIKKREQLFVICPLIDPSDKLGVKSVEEEYEKLKKKIFPQYKIAKLHGKLKSVEKEKIMQDFVRRKSDILVSTSVVEVGVDIPGATLMIIEGAERFGLAQLHQFRGRIGRRGQRAYCFLFSEQLTPAVLQRLKAVVDCADGFKLAEEDLKLRGAGEIYGTKQSGLPDLKIARLDDYELGHQTREAAKKILPNLNNYPLLIKKLSAFAKSIHWE